MDYVITHWYVQGQQGGHINKEADVTFQEQCDRGRLKHDAPISADRCMSALDVCEDPETTLLNGLA